MNFGIVFEVLLIFALIFLPPLQSVFHTSALNLQDFLILCVWPPLILVIEEVRKALVRKKVAKNYEKRTER